MATVTGLTAARMIGIEDATIVDADIVGGNLILTRYDGTTINAGPTLGPAGPTGPSGPPGGLIPGEVKLWPSKVLPVVGSWGHWAWADGAVYSVATYPIAAATIATEWRTFAGASDPGPTNFRVPDLRGLVPAGLDAMPGGARANRMTRTVAITIAAKTGEETHVLTISEMPAHDHPVTDPGHRHHVNSIDGSGASAPAGAIRGDDMGWSENAVTGMTIGNRGGSGTHENVQPTVFVPYIVKLDG